MLLGNWDPSSVDCKVSDDVTWYDAISDDPDGERFFRDFDEHGNHRAVISGGCGKYRYSAFLAISAVRFGVGDVNVNNNRYRSTE